MLKSSHQNCYIYHKKSRKASVEIAANAHKKQVVVSVLECIFLLRIIGSFPPKRK